MRRWHLIPPSGEEECCEDEDEDDEDDCQDDAGDDANPLFQQATALKHNWVKESRVLLN